MDGLRHLREDLWPDDRLRRLIHGVGAAVVIGTIVAVGLQVLDYAPTPEEGIGGMIGVLALIGTIAGAGCVPHVLGSLSVRAARRPVWVGAGWGVACIGDLGSRVYILGGFMNDPLAFVGLITFPVGWAVFVVAGLAVAYGGRWGRSAKSAHSGQWAVVVGGAALIGAIGIGAQLAGWATLSLLLWCVAVAGGGMGALAGVSKSA